MDEAGLDFDKFPDADGPVEVNIADRGGDAAAAAPLCGGGIGGVVDPFEQFPSVDEAEGADVGALDAGAVVHLVATRLRLLYRLHVGPLCRRCNHHVEAAAAHKENRAMSRCFLARFT